MKKELPIGLSNRHIHLSQEDIDVLFGSGYELTKAKDLAQPGQYASNEKVDVQGDRGTIKGIRVLGPARDKSQVEVSLGDARTLGVDTVLRDSGDLKDTPGVKLIGPKGEVDLEDGVIIASRHIHMSVEDGERFNIKDQDKVRVRVDGPRALIFENVLVRVSENFRLEMHVDVEEGNAAGAKNNDIVEILD